MNNELEAAKAEQESASQYDNQTVSPSSSMETLLSDIRSRLQKAQSIMEKRKVLVIEDSTDTLRMLRVILEREGLAVIAAESGREGLKAVEAERPDLIIIDVNMPGLSGIETIRLLREQPELSEVPILAISAYGQWALARAAKAGADRTMNKPIEPDLLVDDVKQLLH